MKKLVYILFLVEILISGGCKEEKKANNHIQYGEYNISGDIKIKNNDTILDGSIKYYDSSNKLVADVNFKDNQKLGKTVRYYNGKVIEETNYYFDYENGLKSDYDTMGNLIIQTNYFFNTQFGPRINYIKNLPYYFRFVNFDQQILYECKYENGKIKNEKGNLIHYTTDYIEEDGVDKLQLFIYIIEPPFEKISYKLYDVDLISDTGRLVHVFSSNGGYFQNFIMDVPMKDHKYILRTDLYIKNDNLTKRNEADLVLPKQKNEK
jgi:hypothetical protein